MKISNQVKLDIPVYDVVKDHPELLDVLVDLGFHPLANPSLLNSLGRVTTIRQGAQLIKLPLNHIIQHLEWNGYEVIQ
ncbi:DUF1858 domain-containing protein [Facklamia lactis]|uniref:DUF1858 domain-containing protein n=1 Tax=Facklamia lactis TaxID=2749967 RepID=UPI001C5541F5